MEELCDTPKDRRMSQLVEDAFEIAKEEESYDGLKREVKKWREFGTLLTQSYQDIKRENTKLQQERTTDCKIKEALSEQITKLKMLLHFNNREDSEELVSLQCKFQDLEVELNNERKQTAALKREIVSLRRKTTLETQELEFSQRMINELNERVRKLKDQLRSYKAENRKNRDLSRSSFLGGGRVQSSKRRLEQCSKMAQEIIALRSDLSRSPFKSRMSSESPEKLIE